MIEVREIKEKSDNNSKVLEFYNTSKERISGKTKLEILQLLERENREFIIIAQSVKNYDKSIFRVRVFNKK